MKLTPRVFGALVLATVVFFYGTTSQVAWLFLLGYSLYALVAAAFLYALWNSRGVRARLAFIGADPGPHSPLDALPEAWLRTAPRPRPVFEGDRVRLALELRSLGRARGPARWSGWVAGKEVSAAAGLVPAAGWRVERGVGPVRRGGVASEGWRLEAGDPLGMFRVETRFEPAAVTLALPRFATLSLRPRVRELEASLAAPRAGAGNELFGVREYRLGDPLRRIHWRSSARRGELVVREYEPPGQQLLTMLLDPDPPSPEVADQIARLAASEAWDCLRAGGRVLAWAPGLEPTTPAEARSLWAILEWLARYPALEPADTDPPPSAEAVALLGSAQAGVLEALAAAGRRGAEARAWLIGFQADVGVPARSVELAWPL